MADLTQLADDLKGICQVTLKGERVFLVTTPEGAEALDNYLQSAFPIEGSYGVRPRLMLNVELGKQSKYEIMFTPYFHLNERDKQQAIHEVQARLPHAIKDYVKRLGKHSRKWRT